MLGDADGKSPGRRSGDRRNGAPQPPGERAQEDREATLRASEQAVLERTASVERREQVADRRERAADRREQSSALLREANERLVIATVSAQNMTEVAEEAGTRMAHAAAHDFLTGLPNRAALLSRLDEAVALARQHGKRVGVLFIDVDHFKEVNDALGHEIGDLVLQAVAARLVAGVRGADLVSRLGGDEFVVLLGELKAADDIDQVANKLLAVLAQPLSIAGHRLVVGASIGSAVFPDDGADVAILLKNADSAMYQAKRAGRKGWRRYGPS
jgi:diguanylate cyclase (GGDEF)-like protein